MRVKLEHWEHDTSNSVGVSNVYSEEFECTLEEYQAMLFFAECRYQNNTYEGVESLKLTKAFLVGKEEQYQKWMLDEEGNVVTDVAQYLRHMDQFDLDGLFEEISCQLPKLFKYYDNTDKLSGTSKALGGVFKVIQL